MNFLLIPKQELVFHQRSLGHFTGDELIELSSIINAAINPGPLQRIIVLTCQEFGIDYHQMMAPGRTERLAVPRQVAMALLREYGLSLESVASIFDKDRATALYSTKAVKRRCETQLEFATKVSHIRRELNKVENVADASAA